MLKDVILKSLKNLSIYKNTLKVVLKGLDNVTNLDLEILPLFPCKNRREFSLLCPQKKNPKIQVNAH